MEEIEKQLTAMISKFQAIAKKNNDQFRYRLEIEPPNRKPRYRMVVEETADNHAFISGHGQTVAEALAAAEHDIPEACKSWGYKAV